MNFTYYKYFWLLLGSIFFNAALPIAASANENINFNTLNIPTIHLAQNAKSNGKNNAREYTFKAPDSKVISNTDQLVKVRGYRVEVYGSEQELLEQVKSIEPSAFIKGNTIQVGIFSQQTNAENMVKKLAVKGFWARINITEN
ncbi:MAG: SPOR domain-containing protein [Cyanobacteria bacterium P01_G01_bin.19]